jgi:hypothetical protein
MSDDAPIANPSAKIKAQLVITLFEAPDGSIGGLNLQTAGEVTEPLARFMMDKTRATLDDHWRMANAPRIMPGNGAASIIPDAIKRHFRG